MPIRPEHEAAARQGRSLETPTARQHRPQRRAAVAARALRCHDEDQVRARSSRRRTPRLSVISRADWDIQKAARPYLGRQPTPTTHYGPWADQARIGQLTPARADKWWRIARGAATEPVEADALADLLTYAVPWLTERITR
jgi:hypothetical protein